MESSHKTIGILLVLGGLGVIVAVFFLLLDDIQSRDIFYLNLIVSCLVYVLLVLRSNDIFGTVEQVAESGSGFGLKWRGLSLYAPLAVLAVALSFLLHLGFALWLIVQIVLLLMFLGYQFIGAVASSNVNMAIEVVEERKTSLNETKSRVDALEMACRMKGQMSYIESIESVKEHLRYVTPSVNPSALELEDKLKSRIEKMTSQIELGVYNQELAQQDFKECLVIIEMRKKLY